MNLIINQIGTHQYFLDVFLYVDAFLNFLQKFVYVVYTVKSFFVVLLFEMLIMKSWLNSIYFVAL